MNDLNPYQSPSTPVGSLEETSADTEAVLRQAALTLARTKPWVRLISVLGFLVFGLLMLAVGLAVMTRLGVGSGGVILLLMLLIAGLFYLVPSVLLWGYANRIGEFLIDETPQALAAAIGSQKSFWKYVGIASAVGITLYLGFFIIAGIVGALG